MNLKKIFLAIIILAVLAYALFVYRDRFWETSKTDKSNQETAPEFSGQESSLHPTDNNMPKEDILDTEMETTEEEQEEGPPPALEDYLADCNNKCESFFGAQLDRCLEICQIKPVDKEAESDPVESCELKTGTEKDFCYKSQAVKEKNDSLCGKITDQATKNACFNAVAEAILDL